MKLMEKIKSIIVFSLFIILIGGTIYYLVAYKHWILLGLLVGGIGIFIGFILLLGYGIEAGFREKFPMDYIYQLTIERNFFHEQGFTIIKYLDAGTDNPGILLERDGLMVEVRLNAPLAASNYYTRISSPTIDTLYVQYKTKIDYFDKNRQLQEFYKELINLHNS